MLKCSPLFERTSAYFFQRKNGQFEFLFTDWSHIGFELYREGSAILSKQRILKQNAAYVSTEADVRNIHSRKIAMAKIAFPAIGWINVFSVHLSRWEDGFQQQFEKLLKKNSRLRPTSARILYSGQDYKRVSDHVGYLVEFEPEV